MKRKSAIQRSQSLLCREAIKHDMAAIRDQRRAAEKIVALPGQGGATIYVTTKRS